MRQSITHLSNLTFASVAPISHDPRLVRRQRIVDRLEEQKRLSKDPTFTPVVRHWKKTPDGSRTLVDSPRLLKPWWRTDGNGSIILTIKSGLRVLEFEKGKTGIVVGSIDRLEGALDTLIAAARAEELDALIEGTKKPQTQKQKKVA